MQTSYAAETSRLGLEPRLSVLETDVLPLTLPTLKYAILTRRSRASNRKLETCWIRHAYGKTSIPYIKSTKNDGCIESKWCSVQRFWWRYIRIIQEMRYFRVHLSCDFECTFQKYIVFNCLPIARVGLEPTTFGLWDRRANHCYHLAFIKSCVASLHNNRHAPMCLFF